MGWGLGVRWWCGRVSVRGALPLSVFMYLSALYLVFLPGTERRQSWKHRQRTACTCRSEKVWKDGGNDVIHAQN